MRLWYAQDALSANPLHLALKPGRPPTKSTKSNYKNSRGSKNFTDCINPRMMQKMASNSTKEASTTSFNDFIQQNRIKERKRKQNEDLASQIFKKSQKSSSPSPFSKPLGIQKKIPPKPLNRRAISENNTNSTYSNRNQRLHQITNEFTQDTDNNKFYQNDSEINIRGKGGRTVVIAKNFAAGTSIFDIISVMVSNDQDALLSSRLITFSPVIIAELIFNDRAFAENVVKKFNNKKADGKLLQVYIETPTDQDYNNHRFNINNSSSKEKDYQVRNPRERKDTQNDLPMMDLDDSHNSNMKYTSNQKYDNDNNKVSEFSNQNPPKQPRAFRKKPIGHQNNRNYNQQPSNW